MALRLVYATIADQVVSEFPNPTDLQELTVWCIENNIVYPSAHWDESGLHFLGWKFDDKSRIYFDDDKHEWIKVGS